MNGKCFEIGTIQAFLDGETTPDVSFRLTDHVASCDACAILMAEADEQSSVVFSTLGRELDALVPTQRLWCRINETIEIENGGASTWHKVFAYIRTSLANPSMAAAAGVLLILGMFAVVVTIKDSADSNVAGNGSGISQPGQTPVQREVVGPTSSEQIPAASIEAPSVTISNIPPKKLEAIAVQANAKAAQREFTPQRAVYNPDAYLPGEESYVRTIGDLKQNVDIQKEAVLTPSTRVSYERDMAVVNDSIKRMREVVRKNPRNQAARQVLYASYQDKIDLLNSVSQREELMAQLR
jgi:hypothetical protein